MAKYSVSYNSNNEVIKTLEFRGKTFTYTQGPDGSFTPEEGWDFEWQVEQAFPEISKDEMWLILARVYTLEAEQGAERYAIGYLGQHEGSSC